MTDKNCPVCGEGLTVQRNTPKKLLSGVIYHFCSEGCRDEFVRDPSEHISGRRRNALP